MTTMTNEQIEQLKQQLKEKQEEIKILYSQLVEAGAVEVPDDFLDGVAGGGAHRPYPSTGSTSGPSTVFV